MWATCKLLQQILVPFDIILWQLEKIILSENIILIYVHICSNICLILFLIGLWLTSFGAPAVHDVEFYCIQVSQTNFEVDWSQELGQKSNLEGKSQFC